MSKQKPFDTQHCPLCGETNACALAQAQNPNAESCWCQQATFTDAIRAQAQEKNRALNQPASCICKACAEKAEQLASSAT